MADIFTEADEPTSINPDLQKERNTSSFSAQSLTELLDGGAHLTTKRREITKKIFEDPLFKNWTKYFNTTEEHYELGIRRFVRLMEMAVQHNWSQEEVNMAFYATRFDFPIVLHVVMFIPGIGSLGTEKQKNKWLPLAHSLRVIGTYAQTELGHGTNLRKLETVATYDVNAEEFVLNSPFPTGMKFWPGGMGKSANHVILLARLEIAGKSEGIQAFVVPIRDMDTHLPLPGVNVGSIGPKLGIKQADNGYLILKNIRIPRENMLSRYAEVLKDGTFVKKGDVTSVYATMVLTRVEVVRWAKSLSGFAVTAAVRYSAVRRQTEIHPGKGEVQVLDFQTQQMKLFPCLAMVYAFHFVHLHLDSSYKKVFRSAEENANARAVSELHSQSCCLKALATELSVVEIESCRRSCGGHGYLRHSGVGDVLIDCLGTVTFEGENTVLYQQTARFLLKNFMKGKNGQVVAESCQYLTREPKSVSFASEADCFDPEKLSEVLFSRAHRQIATIAHSLQEQILAGIPDYLAWQEKLQLIVDAAKAHADAFVANHFWRTVQSLQVASPVRDALKQLSTFYLLCRIIANHGDCLETGVLMPKQVTDLRRAMYSMLPSLRKEAVSLVDALDIHDDTLCSALGCYDGHSYERLYALTKLDPMNADSVHPSYYKYLKPFQLKKLKANL